MTPRSFQPNDLVTEWEGDVPVRLTRVAYVEHSAATVWSVCHRPWTLDGASANRGTSRIVLASPQDAYLIETRQRSYRVGVMIRLLADSLPLTGSLLKVPLAALRAADLALSAMLGHLGVPNTAPDVNPLMYRPVALPPIAR